MPCDVLDLLDLLGKQKNKNWFLSSFIYVKQKRRCLFDSIFDKKF